MLMCAGWWELRGGGGPAKPEEVHSRGEEPEEAVEGERGLQTQTSPLHSQVSH